MIVVNEAGETLFDKAYTAVWTTDDQGTTLNSPVSLDAEADVPEDSGVGFKIQGDTTITVTNTRNKQQIVVYKTDDSTPATPLGGAQFTINKETITSSSDLATLGYTRVITLPVSTTSYSLVETQAPSGYIPQTSEVQVTVSADGVSYDNQAAEFDDVLKAYKIIVTNKAGTELPETGGIGTDVFAAVGGVMALFAGAVLVLRRRRKAFEA